MKEHLLSDNDRAALQSLVPLAGAVGAGTIFSLFAGNRRGAGLSVFEVFAIVAVLTAAALTATLSINLLHLGQAITSRELTQTAMPLVIGVMLLVVVVVYTRITGSVRRTLVILPFIFLAIIAAAALVISWENVTPGTALVAVGAIFLAGLVLSGLARGADRYFQSADRQAQQRRVRRLVKLGYAPREIAVVPALPRLAGSPPAFTGWVRGDRTVLDYEDAERFRDMVRACWNALSDGDAVAATGDSILLDVQLEHRARSGRGLWSLRATLLQPGAKEVERAIEIAANADGLFDVSELVG